MIFFKNRWQTKPGRLSLRRVTLFALALVLAFVGLSLLALNERALRDYRVAMVRHGGEIRDLDARSVLSHRPKTKMVRVYGWLRVPVSPHDPDFGQAAPSVALIRHVAMFQWRQLDIGGQITYELDWVDHPVDARGFSNPRAHANPGPFPLQTREFDARTVLLRGLALTPPMIRAIPGTAWLTPDMDRVPANLAASFSRHGRYLVTSQYPDSPVLGDLRVSWEIVPLQRVTVVAMLNGGDLQSSPDPQDEKGFRLQVGNRALADLFPDLPLPPDASALRRSLSLALVLAGALLLFAGRRRPVAEYLLSAGAALVLVGTVAAMIWLGSGSDMSLRWAGCAVAGCALIAGVIWQQHRSGHDSSS